MSQKVANAVRDRMQTLAVALVSDVDCAMRRDRNERVIVEVRPTSGAS